MGFYLISGIILCILVLIDTRRHKQSMSIMGIVWPLTMLWASWIGLLAYILFGRQKRKPMDMYEDDMIDVNMASMNMSEGDMSDMNMQDDDMVMATTKHKWQGVVLSTLHCGAGCTLADIIGESITSILGLSLTIGWSLDYLLALVIGVYFQYAAIQQMGRVRPGAAISRALKSDILSLTAWQIGMYGFMAIYFTYFSVGEIDRMSYEFWFVMQLAMIAGFILSYPMNILLIKMGLKHAM